MSQEQIFISHATADDEFVKELRRALGRMEKRLRAAGSPAREFLLQKLAQGGHEVIFGISTDPRFGPLLMFGLGGKYVEVFRDVRFAVTPLAPSEARNVVRGIRGYPLLEGVRGEAPADVDLLVDVLLRLAQLAVRHPRIQELIGGKKPVKSIAVPDRLVNLVVKA